MSDIRAETEQVASALLEIARDSRRYRLLRDAIQTHLDTFGYDNHEDLADALVEAESYRS